MSRQVRVTIDLTVDDDEIGDFIVANTSGAGGILTENGMIGFDAAVVDYLLTIIAPDAPDTLDTPDNKAWNFFNRFYGRHWLGDVLMDADYSNGT